MNIDALEKREQILQLSSKVLQAELERICGAETFSIAEARKKLSKRVEKV